MGGNDYLTKPFSRAELLSRVKTQLNVSELSGRLKKISDFSNKIAKIKTSDSLAELARVYILNALHGKNSQLIRLSENGKIEKALKEYGIESITDNLVDVYNGKNNNLMVINTFIEDYIILVEGKTFFNSGDVEFSKTIVKQARLIKNNIADIATNGEIEKITRIKNKINDIAFVGKEFDSAVFYDTLGNEMMRERMSLSMIKVYFKDEQLLKVHKSYIVNPEYIQAIEKETTQRYKMIIANGKEIFIGRTMFDNLKSKVSMPILF
jgi:hypothetical protein